MGRAAIFNSDYLQSGAYAASVFREVDRLIEKESPMLRLSEVAKRLRVSVRTVQNMIADGRLPAFNFGKGRGKNATYRIREADLEDFIERSICEGRGAEE